MIEKIKSFLGSPAKFIAFYVCINFIFFLFIGVLTNFNYEIFWGCGFIFCLPSFLGIVKYLLIFVTPLFAIPLFGIKTKEFFLILVLIVTILLIFNFVVFNYYSKTVRDISNIRSVKMTEQLIVENFSSQFVDINQNGLLDTLNIKFIIDVTSLTPSKNYFIEFYLVEISEDGEEIYPSATFYFQQGRFNITQQNNKITLQNQIDLKYARKDYERVKRDEKILNIHATLYRDEFDIIQQQSEPKVIKSKYLCSFAIGCGGYILYGPFDPAFSFYDAAVEIDNRQIGSFQMPENRDLEEFVSN